jgi:hypothetical protein
LQPCCQCSGFAVWKQVHYATCFQIAQNRPVSVSLLPCPIIHSKYPCSRDGKRLNTTPHLAQQPRTVNPQAKPPCHASSSLSPESQGKPIQGLGCPKGTPRVAPHGSGKWFGEDMPTAILADAEKPSRREQDPDGQPFPRQVTQGRDERPLEAGQRRYSVAKF